SLEEIKRYDNCEFLRYCKQRNDFMMKKYLPFLMLLMSVVAFAQDKKTEAKNVEGQENKEIGDTIRLPEHDFFMLLDNDDVELANNVPVHRIIKDSLIFALLDDPGAAMIDSLWQRELFESSLYMDLKDSLLNQEYNEVVFNDLPTDTLK